RAIKLTGEPGLAFFMGLHMRISSHGYLGFAAMTASTAREAIELAIRFAPTRTEALGLELHIEGDRAALVLEERIPLGNAREFVIVALMVGLVQIARAVLEGEVSGEAYLDFPKPSYFDRFAQLMPGGVRFDQPSNRLVFEASFLALPLKMADPVAMRLALEQCERELQSLGHDARTVAKVRELLPLPEGFRSLDDVAKLMHVSTRTLKRRLSDHDTSYSALLDELRRERALLLLRDPTLSLDSIAERLGYSDVANFTRAFRRWTGKTPGMIRKA
ncbi:MAG: AraC family transcriptional regulator, partial [Polyangiaceae bacterium]|nr:AraC family transcriptional regulator [Polyangiaceae bacterium]